MKNDKYDFLNINQRLTLRQYATLVAQARIRGHHSSMNFAMNRIIIYITALRDADVITSEQEELILLFCKDIITEIETYHKERSAP